MKKRIFSIIMAICMAVSVLPVIAAAADSGSGLVLKQETVTDAIYLDIGAFEDGYAPVQDTSGKWGYVNEAGELVVECKYDWANYCSEGVALVGMYEEIYYSLAEEYYDGTQLYLVDMKGGEVKLDISHNPCLEQLVGFDYTYCCVNGVVNAYGTPFTAKGEPITVKNPSVLELTEYYEYINGETAPAYEFFAMVGGPCVNGLITMETNGMGQMPAYQTFIMDTQGNIVKTFEPRDVDDGYSGVDMVWITENDLYIVRNSVPLEDEWWFGSDISFGLMDKSGNWILPDGSFDDFRYILDGNYFCDGLLAVMDGNGKFGAINAAGEQVIACRYDYMDPFGEGYAAVMRDGELLFVDTEGKEYTVAGIDGAAAKLDDAGRFEDGIAWVHDSEGFYYLISSGHSNGTFYPVENSVDMGEVGPEAYELDGLYGVCKNIIENKSPDYPEAEAGDSFIYINGVKLELSKPIVDIYEITYEEYVLLPDDQQDEFGNLRERVEKTTPVYVLEEGTQVSFPYGYTWGASYSYIDFDGAGIYGEDMASGGYTPDYWPEEVVLPVVWTLDNVNNGYISRWDITQLCMDEDGNYIYDEENILQTNHVGRLFYEVRAAEEPEHVHKYESVVTEPGCTEEGFTTHSCECGDSYTDSKVAATGHKWDDGKVTTAPTEDKEGVKTFTCTVCEKTKTEAIPALEHTHKYTSEVTEPGCTEEGFTTHSCECGDSYTDSKVAATGHKWDNGKVTNEPTSAEEGEKTFTCAVCGETKTEKIDKLPEPEPDDPEPADNPFTDVAEKDYYFEPVMWAVEEGVTSGISPTSFGPAAGCTRAQVVTFLWRAAGEPAPKSSENPFKDVAEGQYYYDAVLWAVENGITTGLSADSFGPNANCNRGQIVTFLWRAMGKPAPESSANPFGDVPESQYYYDAVLWAVEKGITTGLNATSFGPNSTCTRGQIVTFLYRAYK